MSYRYIAIVNVLSKDEFDKKYLEYSLMFDSSNIILETDRDGIIYDSLFITSPFKLKENTRYNATAFHITGSAIYIREEITNGL